MSKRPAPLAADAHVVSDEASRVISDAVSDVAAQLVEVPGGVIVMLDEGSRRTWRVAVAPFLLSRVCVTRGVFHTVMGGEAVGGQTPIVDVSWLAAARFCNALSVRAGLTPAYVGLHDSSDVDAAHVHAVEADGYRLPTEAEWEYACRAGSNAARYGDLDAIAWHRANAGDVLHGVGLKQPNAWGLFDMIGNVWEWCEDVYDPSVYGTYRVFRGGGYADLPGACRASCRRKSHPAYAAEDVGFRLARAAGTPTAAPQRRR